LAHHALPLQIAEPNLFASGLEKEPFVMRPLFAALAFLASFSTSWANDSQYTTLQECAQLQSYSVNGETYEAVGSTYISQCPGVGGWALIVVEQEPRSFIVLDNGERAYSLESDILDVGDFPNVTATKLAEWRLDAQGRPVALIFRVSYMRGNAAKTILMVQDLRIMPPALIGTTTSNEKARRLADG